MKKAFFAVALAGFAQVASAAIAGSAHDLSSSGPNAAYRGTLSACQYCHAPHKANTSVEGAPLWNRTLDGTGFTVYTTLGSGTLEAPGANSLTCLSCHDGATAMGQTFTGTDDAAVPVLAAASFAYIGKDLRGDHPVGVPYVASAQFKTIVQTPATVKLYTAGAGLSVECGSCHDPHGRTGFTGGGSDGATGGESFLRVSAATLCTDCHSK